MDQDSLAGISCKEIVNFWWLKTERTGRNRTIGDAGMQMGIYERDSSQIVGMCNNVQETEAMSIKGYV